MTCMMMILDVVMTRSGLASLSVLFALLHPTMSRTCGHRLYITCAFRIGNLEDTTAALVTSLLGCPFPRSRCPGYHDVLPFKQVQADQFRLLLRLLSVVRFTLLIVSFVSADCP